MASKYNAKIPEFTQNLVSLYNQATRTDLDDGASWYPRNHQIVVEWAEHYGYSIATVASVIAAISPQCDWPRNLVIADDILASNPPSIGGALPRNVRCAQHIRDKRLSNTLDTMPHGPKVASFACNLAGDWTMVTVDTHCLQAAYNDVKATITLHWPQYAAFAEAYRQAAWQVGLEPAIFQSIVWHVWKRLYPRVSKIQTRKQWEVIGDY